MKTATVAQVQAHFGAVLKESGNSPVVVTRDGQPVAVLVGVQDEEEIERLFMACSPRLQAIVDTSRQQIRDGDFLEHEEFWKAVSESRKPTGGRKRPAKPVNGRGRKR